MALIKALALLLSAAFLASCESPESASSVNNSPTSQSQLPARRVADLDQALVGHWQSGRTELFFSPSKLVRIEGGASPEVLNYSVQASDKAQSTLLLKMSVPTGWHWMEVRFTPDRMEFSRRVWREGDKLKLHSKSAHYVDGKQVP